MGRLDDLKHWLVDVGSLYGAVIILVSLNSVPPTWVTSSPLRSPLSKTDSDNQPYIA